MFSNKEKVFISLIIFLYIFIAVFASRIAFIAFQNHKNDVNIYEEKIFEYMYEFIDKNEYSSELISYKPKGYSYFLVDKNDNYIRKKLIKGLKGKDPSKLKVLDNKEIAENIGEDIGKINEISERIILYDDAYIILEENDISNLLHLKSSIRVLLNNL